MCTLMGAIVVIMSIETLEFLYAAVHFWNLEKKPGEDDGLLLLYTKRTTEIQKVEKKGKQK